MTAIEVWEIVEVTKSNQRRKSFKNDTQGATKNELKHLKKETLNANKAERREETWWETAEKMRLFIPERLDMGSGISVIGEGVCG